MRTRHLAAVVLAASLVLSCPAHALERTAARLDADRADNWNAGATITLRYYNACTGWIWILSGFAASDQFGVWFEGAFCPWPPEVSASWHYVYTGPPSGYGFTGSIALSAADANACPVGVPIETQPFLPVTGWNVHAWVGSPMPDDFLIHVTLGAGNGTPLAMATDHPAPVGGGPAACGTCYPTSRVNHSFYYGPGGACPGSVFFNDGTCDAQLLWDCDLVCYKAVEPQSWGSIKSLYR